jgi:hypothetical protein
MKRDVKFTGEIRKAVIQDSGGSRDEVYVLFNEFIVWEKRWWRFSDFEGELPVYVQKPEEGE